MTAMSKVPSKQLRGTLMAQLRGTIEDFTNMNRYT